MKHTWLVALALFGGCTASREGGVEGWTKRPALYKAPEVERCAKFTKGSGPAAACEESKYLGQIYVRRLAGGDEVCLQGGFGDPPGGACLARAAVVDTAANKVLVEVRQARPESKWFDHEQHQFWFEEGALVDLYVSEHGY